MRVFLVSSSVFRAFLPFFWLEGLIWIACLVRKMSANTDRQTEIEVTRVTPHRFFSPLLCPLRGPGCGSADPSARFLSNRPSEALQWTQIPFLTGIECRPLGPRPRTVAIVGRGHCGAYSIFVVLYLSNITAPIPSVT